MRIGIGVNKKRGSEKNGISIKIIGIACFSFIVGNEISNYQLFRIVPSAMVIIGTLGQTRDSRTMIDVSMSRSGGERQFTIGWGAGLACMTGLVNVLVISQGIRKNLKRWQTHEFSMNSYFARILTFILWNQRRFTISRFGRRSFPDGVQNG